MVKRLREAQELSARLQAFEKDVLGAPAAPPAAAPGSRPGTAGSSRPGTAGGGASTGGGGGGGADPAVALAPLPPGAESARLQAEADHLAKEAAFCGRVQAARAWLLLRGGALDALAAGPLSRAPDDPSEAGEGGASGTGSAAGGGWDWEWWVLAQAHYHRGDLPVASAALRRGADALRRRAAARGAPGGGAEAGGGEAEGGEREARRRALEALLAPVVPGDASEVSDLADALDAAAALKDAGNALLKKGDAEGAAAKYTDALSKGAPPAFAAVLYGNRAAAHQAAKRWTEALADCGRAAALSPGYAKAHSRAAALMLEVRRPGPAAGVLEALLAGAAPGPGGAFSPASRAAAAAAASRGAAGRAPVSLDAASRRAYEERLAAAKRAARWTRTPHHYRLLGLEKGAGDDDVKK